MACLWQSCCLFFLVIRCAWSVLAPDYFSHLASFDDHYKKEFSVFAVAKQEYSWQSLQANRYGLPRCAQGQNQCRQIGIIGAGAAGLYCGILLAEAGHTVTIFEASDRAGGRILTYRDPKNPSKYIGELGAMHFPLDAQPYINFLIRQRYKLNITESSNSNENTYKYINGIFATNKQARENPDIFQFNTSQSERGKTPDQLYSEAILPILQTFTKEGWPSVLKQWDSYSIDAYLNKMNMSRAAIDYLSIDSNLETTLFVSILEIIRSSIAYGDGTKYYQIQGGNDLLIQAMVAECQTIESNRCSILYSTPISQVQLLTSDQIQLTTNNGMSQLFDTVVVATTATVTQFIDFEPRLDFIQKYLAIRQVHYDCATKILLSFNVSWWYTQENISGGSSVTDLPIREVFYPSTTTNQTDGGTILASYSFTQDSIVWQSLSESDAIELALKQLIKLHNSSSNMRDYFQGGKVKHWCGDPYTRGANMMFTPFQETILFDKLQASISNIHFIGEYTSLSHGWVEGALVSAIRGALAITGVKEGL